MPPNQSRSFIRTFNDASTRFSSVDPGHPPSLSNNNLRLVLNVFGKLPSFHSKTSEGVRMEIRTIATSILLCVTALSSGAAQKKPVARVRPPAAATQPQNQRISKIVREISAERIEASIRKLVSFHTRHTYSETESETRGIGAARRWIKSELDRYS